MIWAGCMYTSDSQILLRGVGNDRKMWDVLLECDPAVCPPDRKWRPGVSMVIFLLRDKAMIDLAGKQSCICHRIEHQTERAVLLSVIHRIDGEEKKNASYWLPKSQILIDNQKPEGMIDLAAAGKIEIPEWLWKERREVP